MEDKETGVQTTEEGVAGGRKRKPLRPAQCRAYMRRELARQFPSIVDGFLKGAESGSCQHVKLATELLAPPPRAKRPPNAGATLQRLVQQMEQIQD